ncbi:MAG: DUF5821 family protein [Halobacteriaceae archaeon]
MEELEAADEFSRRTPGLPRLRKTAEEELGEVFWEDFEAILSEFDEV